MKCCIYVLAITCALSWLAGCNSATPDSVGKIYPVSLTLTQESKPLVGATVALISDDPNAQYTVGGASDEQGTVSIFTDGRYEGAKPGHYKVVVSKVETEEIPKAPLDLQSPEFDSWAQTYSNRSAKSWTLVDHKFGNASTTPLEITVVAGKNEFPLDCGKQIRKEN
ncbi:MAG: hypothetical protein Q4G68_13095 [Planctomycetia bacterium]|nr:hypothetical protein [Planctomycetia bacterium]